MNTAHKLNAAATAESTIREMVQKVRGYYHNYRYHPLHAGGILTPVEGLSAAAAKAWHMMVEDDIDPLMANIACLMFDDEDKALAYAASKEIDALGQWGIEERWARGPQGGCLQWQACSTDLTPTEEDGEEWAESEWSFRMTHYTPQWVCLWQNRFGGGILR